MKSGYTNLAFLIMIPVNIVLFLLIASSSIIVERVPDNPSIQVEHQEGKTSGFLGQVMVGLNAENSEEAGEFAKLMSDAQQINDDVVGWIRIEDFDIDYPVLYSEDNKAYLRHNLYGEYDVAGAIYLDANYGNLYSPMKLIHGHNMKNKSMFGNVPQLLRRKTLDDAPIICYYDNLGLKTFKIFSVFSVNAEKESVIISEYSSLQELNTLKDYYVERSWIPVSEIPDGLEMLMLNTCWYGKTGTERKLHCIVVACRI